MQHCSICCAGIQSLADKGWQVHAIEDATASRLQQHVQEASTSRRPDPYHGASFAVPPDPDMAGIEPGVSFTLTQYLIFGLALAAMLVGALWALQQGQNRAAHSSVKGLITRPYDGWEYYASATDPGWGMHAASSESGSLPLCPEKQLPSWTQTCASYPVQRTGIVNLSQSCTTPQGIWLMSNPDTQVSRASPSAHSFVVHTGLGLWWGTYPLSPISNHECFRCDISACESPDNTVCERVSR